MKHGLRLGLFGVAAVGAMVAGDPAAAQEKRQEYHLEGKRSKSPTFS